MGLTFLCGVAGSYAFIHPLGIAGMAWRLDVPLERALALGATFLPGDAVKNLAMASIATALHRRWPCLRVRPRGPRVLAACSAQ